MVEQQLCRNCWQQFIHRICVGSFSLYHLIVFPTKYLPFILFLRCNWHFSLWFITFSLFTRFRSFIEFTLHCEVSREKLFSSKSSSVFGIYTIENESRKPLECDIFPDLLDSIDSNLFGSLSKRASHRGKSVYIIFTLTRRKFSVINSVFTQKNENAKKITFLFSSSAACAN